MSEIQPFNVEPRKAGKHFSRQARKDRKVPTVIYGPKFKNQNAFAEENLVKKFSAPRFESTIFSLKSDDKDLNDVKVLIKDIQHDPVSDRPVHLDLYALDMTRKVRLYIVLKYEGTPVGVKDEGGILQVSLNELEIECLPTKIPDQITIDISNLGLNESLHVSDITLPADVKAITSEKRTLCSVSSPKEEKEPEVTAAPVEGAEAAAAPAPETEKKD